MKHLSREELDAYLNKQLGVFRTFQCFLHLRSCERCQALLQECREDQELIDAAKQAQKEFDLPDDPELEQHLSTIFDKKQS